jgi:hypothetical protein
MPGQEMPAVELATTENIPSGHLSLLHHQCTVEGWEFKVEANKTKFSYRYGKQKQVG